MAFHITDDCVACGGCAVVCPEGAIDDGYNPNSLRDPASVTGEVRDGSLGVEPGGGSWFYRIAGPCTGCGLCVDVCPTGAIVP